MASPLPNTDGFVDDADPSQPRIVITIDGGLALGDSERVLRDEMIAPFLDEFVLAIRNFYVGRQMLGPPKEPIDAAKLAMAVAKMEAPLK